MRSAVKISLGWVMIRFTAAEVKGRWRWICIWSVLWPYASGTSVETPWGGNDASTRTKDTAQMMVPGKIRILVPPDCLRIKWERSCQDLQVRKWVWKKSKYLWKNFLRIKSKFPIFTRVVEDRVCLWKNSLKAKSKVSLTYFISNFYGSYWRLNVRKISLRTK